ncbi:Hypothetical_protein [Hexamita inflata]|uniref:Hypothetical_protein n=1 Tax=Hexamita inflata TaxID=28002 RepID=A0AA86PMF0_9EUKA|nr:Hypothetical protein HINF_LOCUS30470 [Hexamita inflata]
MISTTQQALVRDQSGPFAQRILIYLQNGKFDPFHTLIQFYCTLSLCMLGASVAKATNDKLQIGQSKQVKFNLHNWEECRLLIGFCQYHNVVQINAEQIYQLYCCLISYVKRRKLVLEYITEKLGVEEWIVHLTMKINLK